MAFGGNGGSRRTEWVGCSGMVGWSGEGTPTSGTTHAAHGAPGASCSDPPTPPTPTLPHLQSSFWTQSLGGTETSRSVLNMALKSLRLTTMWRPGACWWSCVSTGPGMMVCRQPHPGAPPGGYGFLTAPYINRYLNPLQGGPLLWIDPGTNWAILTTGITTGFNCHRDPLNSPGPPSPTPTPYSGVVTRIPPLEF